MSQTDLQYWLALARFPKFGAVNISKLSNGFPSMRDAFYAKHNEFINAGLNPVLAEQFIQERIHINPEHELELLHKHNVQAITIKDSGYPPLLKTIFDPPAVLFIRGVLPDPNRNHLAVVGSRKATTYGIQSTAEIINQVARAGTIIVSGLAYGIDACAHTAALKAGGTTIAVLGSGLDKDNIYPTQNRSLAIQMISNGGAIISEFPIGVHAHKQNFPFRNRVIAGMCHATFVVEAAEKSGSLITARLALESNRDVYALPGSIHSPYSFGPNNLIKMGATPVTCAADILGYEDIPQQAVIYSPGSAQEEMIYKILSKQPLHTDEIVCATNMPIQQVSSTLTLMEMKGSAKHVGNLCYIKT
ncbi:MAG: DNA-processing protein DprA [Patescibacteria group bacterium]